MTSARPCSVRIAAVSAWAATSFPAADSEAYDEKIEWRAYARVLALGKIRLRLF